MEPLQKNSVGSKGLSSSSINGAPKLDAKDKQEIGHIKYAQGVGAALRYASELRAVQQVGRLPFLKSSRLQEDVLRGNLNRCENYTEMLRDDNEVQVSRAAFL